MALLELIVYNVSSSLVFNLFFEHIQWIIDIIIVHSYDVVVGADSVAALMHYLFSPKGDWLGYVSSEDRLV